MLIKYWDDMYSIGHMALFHILFLRFLSCCLTFRSHFLKTCSYQIVSLRFPPIFFAYSTTPASSQCTSLMCSSIFFTLLPQIGHSSFFSLSIFLLIEKFLNFCIRTFSLRVIGRRARSDSNIMMWLMC